MSESNRRQGSPKLAVKEKFKTFRTEGKPGLIEGIFAGIKNPLAPFRSKKATHEKAIRTQETLTPRPPLPKPKKISVRRRERKKEADASNKLIYLLIPTAAVFLLFGINGTITSGESDNDPSGQTVNVSGAENLQERVEYYRRSVGRQINRERIGTEYANQKLAPRVLSGAKRAIETDMLNGVPLAVEKHHRLSSRDRAQLADPDFADNRVAYSLREQEQMNDFDKRAHRQYVEEFIANAAKAGYRVRVDKDGNVKVLGRGPATGSPGSLGAQVPSGPSSSGPMQ
jgi:hypothetical protein